MNGECTYYALSQGSNTSSRGRIGEDSRGVLWITAGAAFYRFHQGSFVLVPVIIDSLAALQALHEKGGVWLAHGRHVLRTLGDSIVHIVDLTKALKNDIQDIIEYPENSGAYWIATNGDGVVRYENGVIKMYSEKEGLSSMFVRKLYVDRANNLWVICLSGISRFEGSLFIPLSGIPALNELQFNVFVEDTEGDYWIGTQAHGLYKLQGAVITSIGEKAGLRNIKMQSLLLRKNGTFLFATQCGGVYEWKNGKATYSVLNSFLPDLCVRSLWEDSKQRVWAGSRTLYRCYDLSKRGELFDASSGFLGTEVHAMIEDSKGRIWIGCRNGLYVYDEKHFWRYTTSDGLSHNDVRSFLEDTKGTMWIGTTNGLNTMKDGKLTRVQLVSPEKDSLPLQDTYIRAMYQDTEGTLWLGSYGNGLIRLKHGSASLITVHQGFYDNFISQIVEDEKGNLWMGCNRGIFRVYKKDLDDVCDGTTDEVHSFSYGKADGMELVETNGGFQPSSLHDDGGNIYFPTMNGVAIVATRKIQYNALAPPVRIEKIYSEGVEIPWSNEITLLPDSTYLEIRYTALSYPEPRKVNFKYKLEGLHNTWLDAGTRRRAVFRHIPPGNFTFQVIACNNDGVWNAEGASIRISVLPPFWMRGWFQSLVLLFFLSSGPSLYYYRVTRLKKEKELQTRFSEQLIASQEQERSRIAAELHDGLGQQILVMKNRAEVALKTVSDPLKTGEQLREIIECAVRSMTDVRAITHDLRPIHLEQFGLQATLEYLCEQVRESSSIEWSYYIDNINNIIPHEREINFYRILQEGINNVIKHSGATRATIMIRKSIEQVTVSVWDNGKGFDQHLESTFTGLGLKGIQERAHTLGGLCEIKSQPGEGTAVIIIIPIQRHG